MGKIRSVAVLGVGAMGAPIADNMEAAGFDVRRWDPKPEAATAPSAAAAADGADAVLTMAPDGEACATAVRAAAPAAGTVWIQCATVSTGDTRDLAAVADECGLAFVDAPVLGTTVHAVARQLFVLASGPESERKECEGVFASTAARQVWLGAAGAGTRMKLVFNAWLHTLVVDIAESLALAQALDVDPRQFLEVVAGTPADTPLLHDHGPAMLRHEFEPGLALEHAHKDAVEILASAHDAGLKLPLTATVLEMTDRALAQGHRGKSFEAVYLTYQADEGERPRRESD